MRVLNRVRRSVMLGSPFWVIGESHDESWDSACYSHGFRSVAVVGRKGFSAVVPGLRVIFVFLTPPFPMPGELPFFRAYALSKGNWMAVAGSTCRCLEMRARPGPLGWGEPPRRVARDGSLRVLLSLIENAAGPPRHLVSRSSRGSGSARAAPCHAGCRARHDRTGEAR